MKKLTLLCLTIATSLPGIAQAAVTVSCDILNGPNYAETKRVELQQDPEEAKFLTGSIDLSEISGVDLAVAPTNQGPVFELKFWADEQPTIKATAFGEFLRLNVDDLEILCRMER